MKRELPVNESIGSFNWNTPFSKYPDRFKVTMTDGQQVWYRIDNPLPRPHLANGMNFDSPKKHEKK